MRFHFFGLTTAFLANQTSKTQPLLPNDLKVINTEEWALSDGSDGWFFTDDYLSNNEEMYFVDYTPFEGSYPNPTELFFECENSENNENEIDFIPVDIASKNVMTNTNMNGNSDFLVDDLSNLGAGVYCLNYVMYQDQKICDTLLIKVTKDNRDNVTDAVKVLTSDSSLFGGMKPVLISSALILASGFGLFSSKPHSEHSESLSKNDSTAALTYN